MADTENITDQIEFFDRYLHQANPDRANRATLWQTAVGLQDVDRLVVSWHLLETARRHIEGSLTLDDCQANIAGYWQEHPFDEPQQAHRREADLVAVNIVRALSDAPFSLSPDGLIDIHRRLFYGVFDFAGQVRDHDIAKKEWVLGKDTVQYGRYQNIQADLNTFFTAEKTVDYQRFDTNEMISHLAEFLCNVWRTHTFCEGNTRTVSVFAILYLRSKGFQLNLHPFAVGSWYLRNAFVRASYSSDRQDIERQPLYLERFLRNVLLGDMWELRSHYLHITPHPQYRSQPNLKPHHLSDVLHSSSSHRSSSTSRTSSSRSVNWLTRLLKHFR